MDAALSKTSDAPGVAWDWRNTAVATWGLAMLVGIFAGWLAWHTQHSPQHLLVDFNQNYAAARFLREGRDPYQLIGPGRAFDWQWPLFYPLTSAVFALPFTFLPVSLAGVVFAGVSASVFAVAVARWEPTRPWRYVALVSKPFLVAIVTGQAACLLASAFVLAPFGALAAIKPNIGAAIVLARGNRRGVVWALGGGLVLLAISLALRPGWIPAWLHAVRADPFRTPAIGRPGGFLLLLAVLRWRRPEARLLLALSIVPQTLFIYDALPLFFIPRRASEAIALVALSHFAFLMGMSQQNAGGVDSWIVAIGNWVVWCLFLPSLLMVLRRRNESIERAMAP